MEEREFVRGSREAWERLAADVREARHSGVAEMGPAALKRLHEDYRRTAADLAYAQTHYPGSRTTAQLNALVGSAHAELYGAAPRKLSSAWRFLAAGWPRLVRRHARPIMLAAALVLGATALGYLLAYVNYPLARLFLPEALRDGLGDSMERGNSAAAIAEAAAPLLAAAITANNIQVSLAAFAGGITFGVITVYALVMNGMLIGVLAAVFAKSGEALPFWSLIVPHGALEIPAIILAGGAGLILGRALLFPGDRTRGAALRAVSGEAAQVVVGAIPLLLLAGVIEAFVTPRELDPLLKVAFGVAAFLLFAAYVGLAGRATATDTRR